MFMFLFICLSRRDYMCDVYIYIHIRILTHTHIYFYSHLGIENSTMSSRSLVSMSLTKRAGSGTTCYSRQGHTDCELAMRVLYSKSHNEAGS